MLLILSPLWLGMAWRGSAGQGRPARLGLGLLTTRDGSSDAAGSLA
jgi:hypothetical protein